MTLRFCKAVALVTGCALGMQVSVFAAEPSATDATSFSSLPAESLQSLPDAPSVVAQAQTPPANPAGTSTPPAPQTGDKNSASPPQQPKGAAAAEVQKSTGTAASTPSGAAIAPAKQKRSRSFLIRMGALAGAGIAIGTVVALSSAGPSKPPGAN
jgi:cell division septation protein DedD